MKEDAYEYVRGDGSIGQFESIIVDSPSDETTYRGQISLDTFQSPVEFMIIFAGLNDIGETVIFDYLIDDLDPITKDITSWEFTYQTHYSIPAKFEYIDDRFPWDDGYKPKQAEISSTSAFPLSEVETDSAYLYSLPPCGWLGVCLDKNCDYYMVTPA